MTAMTFAIDCISCTNVSDFSIVYYVPKEFESLRRDRSTQRAFRNRCHIADPSWENEMMHHITKRHLLSIA